MYFLLIYSAVALLQVNITPVMYTDSDGNMAELIAGLTFGQVALAVVAVVVATVAVLAIADVIGIPGTGDVLDGVKDTINQIGQSIQNSLDKMKQNIKIFAIAAAIAIGTKNNSGTYVIQFESGHVYVGKGGYLRACTSALYQSLRHGDTPTAFIYYSAANDREAFKQEYILMVDYGFHKTDVLYNQIWSPGRVYYYQDNGSYYPGDPGW